MEISRRGLIASSAALALAGCGKKKPALTFAASSPVWWNPVPIIAERRGALKNRGFELKNLMLENGAQVRDAVASGKASMGVASTNAFTTASDADLRELKILGSVTHTSAMVALFSRIPEPAQMMRGRVGYTPGTISEFYLIAYLQKSLQIELYTRQELQLVPMTPPALVEAFKRGDLDVVVTWEPYAEQIAGSTVFMTPLSAMDTEILEDGSEVSTAPVTSATAGSPLQIRDESLYTQHIFAFTSVKAVYQQRPQIEAALQGLKDTVAWIAANRAQCARELDGVFRDQHVTVANNPLWNRVAVEFINNGEVVHEALLRDHQTGVLAGVSRASMNALNALTDAPV